MRSIVFVEMLEQVQFTRTDHLRLSPDHTH
jgi:hypothetical protein